MEYLFECETGSGLIISSKEWFNSLSEELAYRLCVVIDIDAQTALEFDYPNRNWNDVWREESEHFLRLCNSGLAAFIVLREGVYNIKINLGFPDENKLLHFANLQVKYNDIYLAEAEEFLVSYFSEEEYEALEQLIISPGLYELYYKADKEEAGVLINIFFKKVEQFSADAIQSLASI